jgi:hypothetical protein
MPVPDEPDPQTPEPNDDIRRLREKADSADAALKQVQELQRRVAFAEAGLPTAPWRAYFDKGYEGELTAEAIKAAATEAGFLEAPKPPEQTTPEERATHQRIADASAGASTAPPVDWAAEYAAAKTPEEVMAIVQRQGLPTVWDRT